jgi:transcriptional regulator with XRE-family HTH domain
MNVESIKRRRKALGLSLTDVATRANLHDEAVARMERANVDPKASSIVRIARALGVPVCELFDDPGHHHAKRHAHRSPGPRREER